MFNELPFYMMGYMMGRALAWLFTRGWPFGIGLLAYIFFSGGVTSDDAAVIIGLAVTAGCLALRFSLRHPEAAKSWKEHFGALLKRGK